MSDIKLTSDITVNLIEDAGGDHSVVASARVSTCGEDAVKYADPDLAEANAGLIRYLMKHRHGTPFEHGMMTFSIHAPVFVFRQMHRHRVGWSFNELSGRYSELEPVFWVPREYRPIVAAEGHKPARPKFKADERVAQVARRRLQHVYEDAYSSYQNMLSDGVCSEVARACLPVGIYSTCWATTNPRALMHFLSLRTTSQNATTPSYPQSEIEDVARQMEGIFSTLYPITWSAFNSNGRIAP